MKLKKFKFKKVKSTNNTAIRIVKETKYNLGMVVAETQINGERTVWKKMDIIKRKFIYLFFQ